jgi:hypothetical protein
VLTGIRSAGNLAVTLPLLSATEPGLAPAMGTPEGRFLKDDGTFAALSLSSSPLSNVEVNSSQPVSAGVRYFIAASSITLTLPASPAFGDFIQFVPESASITGVTIARNGQRIMGLLEDMTVDGDAISFGLTYADATNGWRIY